MKSSFVFTLACWIATSSLAADWNQFRGPQTDGVAAGPQPPVEWSAEPHKNILWKAPLPQPGNGSPIVSGDKVFVTCALDKEGIQRSLLCFDRATGKQLWVRTAEYKQPSKTHETNPYCGSTPAADGQRVVVWHASAGLFCYDFAGNELWSRDLGEFEHMWGYGGSPILYQGRVLLNCSPSKTRTFVTAINLDNGETLWETEEPMDGDGEYNKQMHYMGSWTTPTLVTVNGQMQMICAQSTRLVGYDPETGEILWWCEGNRGDRGDLAYSSPLCDGKVCISTGGFQGPAIAVQLGGTGDITKQRLWRKPENPQSIGSGILRGDIYYLPNTGPGTVQCLDVSTGNERWVARIGGEAWGSIVAVGDLMYVTNQNGDTVAFRHNPDKYEEVAVNRLNEPSNSTPAIADGQIFIRTMENLYCIGQK